MGSVPGRGLNDSGALGVTRIVRGGALHHSLAQSTTQHAHYAWKIHVGLDAPVWLESANAKVSAAAGAHAVIAPPGVVHSTGASGWSCAIFLAPGSHGTAWRATSGVVVPSGAAALRLVDACRRFEPGARGHTADFIAEIGRLAFEPALASERAIDARVEQALACLAVDPGVALPVLALESGLSLDRLSRLVTRDTGMRLRQHALWSRLLRLLSSNARHESIARAAFDAGFADHAHLTRTFRGFFGRAPSQFSEPPDALERW
jgi:AraC-like DNA-binding protein